MFPVILFQRWRIFCAVFFLSLRVLISFKIQIKYVYTYKLFITNMLPTSTVYSPSFSLASQLVESFSRHRHLLSLVLICTFSSQYGIHNLAKSCFIPFIHRLLVFFIWTSTRSPFLGILSLTFSTRVHDQLIFCWFFFQIWFSPELELSVLGSLCFFFYPIIPDIVCCHIFVLGHRWLAEFCFSKTSGFAPFGLWMAIIRIYLLGLV